MNEQSFLSYKMKEKHLYYRTVGEELAEQTSADEAEVSGEGFCAVL